MGGFPDIAFDVKIVGEMQIQWIPHHGDELVRLGIIFQDTDPAPFVEMAVDAASRLGIMSKRPPVISLIEIVKE
jgi:hypothetical protein